MSNPAVAPLRELLYLDFERVRTLLSQIPTPDMPAAAGDVRYARSDAETRSLQTSLFNSLEEALAAQGRLTDIAPSFDFSTWTRENFRDGQLVRVAGMIRLLDLPWLASVMETMPRMLKVTHRAELSALKQKREAHQITQAEVDQKVKEQQAQLKDLDAWKMDELTDVVRELFGQTVRIKVIPYNAAPGQMLVGSCQPPFFFEPPAILSQNYGTDINAAWTMVGIINTTPLAPAPPLPTGNAVEDMFERLALAVNRIHRVASAPDFPALSLTPLAIYRNL